MLIGSGLRRDLPSVCPFLPPIALTSKLLCCYVVGKGKGRKGGKREREEKGMGGKGTGGKG